MNKKVILNIESVYTSNAFQTSEGFFVAAGSETLPEVLIYDILNDKSQKVSGCPGGMMSFVPVPGDPDLFFSIMGLFPPFIGAEAGVFMHKKNSTGWETQKAMALPFAHRCDIVSQNGKNYLFSVSVSTFKENPADWSNPGEVHVTCLEENPQIPLQTELIDQSIIRNHGMLKTNVDGQETIMVSGAEGIFYFELQSDGKWVKKQFFDREVSEFGLFDLDGDGQNELVTIEPFHGENLNVYKREAEKWVLKYTDTLSFGHGLSCGKFNGKPVIVAGNRRGSFTLDMHEVVDLQKGIFRKSILEEDAGPTQTQVFTAGGTDYILSSNQKKNEVALYF